MFEVYYYYNHDKHKVTVYSVRREADETLFLIHFNGYWWWVNAATCEPCKDEENIDLLGSCKECDHRNECRKTNSDCARFLATDFHNLNLKTWGEV